jgi:outer membrane protein TolC
MARTGTTANLRILCLLAPLVLAGCQDTGTFPASATAPPTTSSSAAAAPTNPAAAPTQKSAKRRVSSKLGNTGFGRAVALAVQTHPDIGAATADIFSARANLSSAEGAFRPAFSFGADAQTRFVSSTTAQTNAFNPYVRVSQLIYDGGASRSQKNAALAGVTQAQDQRLAAASSSAMSAVETFLALVSAQELFKLQQQNLATHRAFLSQVQERRDAGVGSESDVLTVRSRTSEAETTAIDADAELRQSIARYQEIFGIRPGSVSMPPEAPILSESPEIAINQSPRMRTINAGIQVAQAQVKQAEAQRIPSVALGGTARPDNRGGADVRFELGVEYSFENQRDANANVARARSDLARLQSEKLQLAREIRRSLDFLATDRDAGTKRLRAARNAVKDSNLNVAAARDEFSIGRRTLIEVLDAQRDFVRAQETVVSAQSEKIRTGYQALALTGDIIEAFAITLPSDEAFQ